MIFREFRGSRAAGAALALALLVGLTGCGEDNENPGTQVGSDDTTSGGGEVAGSDGTDGTSGTDGSDGADGANTPDAGGDSSNPDAFDEDLPEDFKAACEENSDCSTGVCIDGPEGNICTITCIENCPGGFSCQALQNAGGDVTYLCVPTWKALCSECASDSDCGGENTRCVEVDGEGKRCSRLCSATDPCPQDYLCQALDDLINLCKPATGSCICTPDLLGQEVTCSRSNELGECTGTQLCGGPGGFTECSAKLPQVETCNGKDDNCDGNTDEDQGGEACEKTNEIGTCTGLITCYGADGLACSATEPAAETCDGKDNDCDGVIDEPDADGCSVYYEDKDKDGLGSALSALCLCKKEGDYTATGAGDCHDFDPTIGEGKIETCNGSDDDCDGVVDEDGSVGCTDFFHDQDGDGYGVSGDTQCLCTPTAPYTALVGGDCQDDNEFAYPGQTETCNGGDDNCNGLADEENAIGCTPYLQDNDSDGYGVTGLAKCLCGPGEVYKALAGEDCNDDDENVNPLALEICDGKDNSCNGIVDEECDKDSDGYCNALKPLIGNPAVCPLGGGDCVDWDANINPGAAESCDGVDNNCKDGIDEGVAAPCGGCKTVCLMGAGPLSDEPFEDGGEFFDGAGTDDDGNIVLDTSSVQLDMIWISNSGEGSVSKISTSTGQEVARYQLCNDPSRTAVDSQGNAWIGCRGDARVVKVALAPQDCPDKNNDGIIQTSSDLNGNGVIDPATEMFGELDECILFSVNPDGTDGKARALGIDKDDHAWVGMWNTKRLWKLNRDTGAVMQKIDLPHRSYGLALDQQGIIWLSGREGKALVRVDPASGSIDSYSPGGTFQPYGMTIDENGRIWTANCCDEHAAYRFDPATNTFAKALVTARGRGIAANGNGYVFVANDQSDKVAKIDVSTMEVVGYVDLGAGRFPVGMAVDFDGMVWAVNQSTSTAMRIHPDTLEILLETPTGPSPYTYSDMTGFQQKTIVAPKGTYRHTFEGWQGGETQWMQVGLELTTPEGTYAQLRVRTAPTEESLSDAVWTPLWGPFPPQLPTVNLSGFGAVIGRYLEVEVTLFAESSNATPILKSVDVVAAAFD